MSSEKMGALTKPGAVLWSPVSVLMKPLYAKSGLLVALANPIMAFSMMVLWPNTERGFPRIDNKRSVRRNGANSVFMTIWLVEVNRLKHNWNMHRHTQLQFHRSTALSNVTGWFA